MRTHLLIASLVLASCPAFAQSSSPKAERVDLADCVVTGKVQRVYRFGKSGGVAEVSIESVEKGRGPKRGRLLYVRFKASTLKASQQRCRLFLRLGRDAGWALIGPSGVEDASEDAPDTPRGRLKQLERELGAIVAAAAKGDKAALKPLIEALKIPNYEDWFQRLLGPRAAGPVVARYKKQARVLVPWFTNVFTKAAGSDASFRVFKATGHRAIGLQRRATFAMRTPLPLYTLKFGSGKSLWSFAYLRGHFRWIGRLSDLPREPLVIRVVFDRVPVHPARGTLKVTIYNASTKVVKDVPTVYDGSSVRLEGRGLLHHWALALRPSVRPRQVMAPLKPKETRVVCTLQVSEVFSPASTRWGWNWTAHPVPPYTPLHRWREAGLEAQATFFVSAEAGGRTINSKPLRVKVGGR